MGRERSEPVTKSGERGSRQRGVSYASPRVQPLHDDVQKWTTTGRAGWKQPIPVLLLILFLECFEKRLCHNAKLSRQPNRPFRFSVHAKMTTKRVHRDSIRSGMWISGESTVGRRAAVEKVGGGRRLGRHGTCR
jgi:hypothetical protein